MEETSVEVTRKDDLSNRESEDASPARMMRRTVASTFSASQFLKLFEDEFFDATNAKVSLLKMKRKGVISSKVASAIEKASDEDAIEELYQHLGNCATVDTLREYCRITTSESADGYPKMQDLGKKMLKELPLGACRKVVPTPTANLMNVEDSDRRYLEKTIKTAQTKKLDPSRIMRFLYHHTFSHVSSLLENEEHYFEDMKRAAENMIDLKLVDADMSNVMEVKSINQLLKALSLSAQWDDTEVFHEVIIHLVEEKRRLIQELLDRYDVYLQVYYSCKMMADNLVVSQSASISQITLEVTSMQEFNECSEMDCKDILKLLLNVAYQIPKGAVVVNGARQGNSTTVMFLVNKSFAQRIMYKTCTDPLTLWIFLELHIIRVRIPELFEVNIIHLVRLQLATAIRNGLIGGADFISVTTAFPYQVCCLLDADVVKHNDVRHRLRTQLLGGFSSDRQVLQEGHMTLQPMKWRGTQLFHLRSQSSKVQRQAPICQVSSSSVQKVGQMEPQSDQDLSMALPIGTPAIKDRKQESDFQVVRDSTLIDIPDTFPTEPIKSSIAPQKDEEQWTVVRRRTKKKDTSKALASKPPRLQPTTAKASVRTPVTKLSVTAKPAVQEQKGIQHGMSQSVTVDEKASPSLQYPPSNHETGMEAQLSMEDVFVSSTFQSKSALSQSLEIEDSSQLPQPSGQVLKAAYSSGSRTEVSVLQQLASAEEMFELLSEPPGEPDLADMSVEQMLQGDALDPDFSYPGDSEEEEEGPEFVRPMKDVKPENIIAEDLVLICDPCLEKISHENYLNPSGTCRNAQHIKKLVVKKAGVNVLVRKRMEHRKMMYPVCEYYPNCYKGDKCLSAHGKEESRYWTGDLKAESELCLDCRFIAVEGLLRNCHSGNHKASVVVYKHRDTKEIVPVKWPKTVPNGPFKVQHPQHSCREPKCCTFQHHVLQTKILNLWKCSTVPASTEPPPEEFLEVLKRAVQPRVSHHSRDNGPLPKEELCKWNKFLTKTEEPHDATTYRERFHILVDWEEHAHMEAMQRNDGKYQFLLVDYPTEGKKAYMQDGEKYAWLGVLFMSAMKADTLRQAAAGVCLCFDIDMTLNAYIQQQPQYHESQPCLAVSFKRASTKPSAMSEKDEFLAQHTHRDVEATFILKHKYFSSLRKSLDLTPDHVLERLVPNPTTLKCKDNTVDNGSVDLKEFCLDDKYQKPACNRLFQSSPAAPFLICGPFGAGKTQLLAIAALILSKNPDNFILIATHHIKTADQYIEKYLPHLNFVDQEELRVARVVGKNVYLNLPVSTREYFKTIEELESDRADYSIIVTTFGVMLQLRTVLEKRKCKFFTHIFVDEGSQAREPETLGAFCYAGPHTKIVIAGDHMQVGPQTSVLGREARDNGLTLSLVVRLHRLYQREDMKDAASQYQAVLLATHRSHPSIFCLPSTLFYEGNVNAFSTSQLHPQFTNSVYFVCTSLDELPDCTWNDDELYTEQVFKEILVALHWVKECAKNWPEVEWGAKDLSSLCVVVPNKHVERLWRRLAKGIWRDVTCNVAYNVQGLEYRAVFICTSEVVDEHCATRDPVKSLCDQYVFNTVITRSCSLVVAIGNPFRLMKIEDKLTESNKVSSKMGRNCWQAFFYYCLQCQSLVLSKKLNSMRQENAELAMQQSTKFMKIESALFDGATEGLKKMHQQCALDVHDSILHAYREKYRDSSKGIIMTGKKNDSISWSSGTHLVEQQIDPAIGPDIITCRLWQTTNQTCTAVPVDPSGGRPVTINGAKNRRCAFNGALVDIKILDEKCRSGKVHSLLQQGSVEPQVCVVDKYSAKMFVPVDNKSPRFKNLPHVARTVLSEKTGIYDSRSIETERHEQQYVVCFDPSTLEPKDIPKIIHLIPKAVAHNLLFMVRPIKWDANRPHPAGAVVAVLPKGISELYACKILAIQHFVPDPKSDIKRDLMLPLTTIKEVSTSSTASTIGIVSKEGFSCCAMTVEEEEDRCVVGFHVCNVADVIDHSEEFIGYQFSCWASVFGECQGKQVYHPILTKTDAQALSFTCDASQNAITFNVEVSATGLAKHVASGQILDRVVNLTVKPIGFKTSTVRCGVMLDWSELEDLLLSLFSDNQHKLTNAGLEKKIRRSPLHVWKILTVLYATADELCFERQGHRGYPELQQSQESIRYPEAWKMINEIMIRASRQAAEQIGMVFPSKILLKAQLPPSEDCMSRVLGCFTEPFFQWLSKSSHQKPHEMETVICTRHLHELLSQPVYLTVSRLRQLLMQPHHHPQLSVVESFLREALPTEEFVVKRITSKQKKTKKVSISALIENAGGKHHSLQDVIAPYFNPFDSIFDIYVQSLLLKAVCLDVRRSVTADDPSEQSQEEVGALNAVARFCNMAVTNSKSYELAMTSLDVAVYAQQSSICVEAFVKVMDNGRIHLCYPDSTLSSICSLQAIKTKLVTKSDKSKNVLYFTKVTCINGPCQILKDLKYIPKPHCKDISASTVEDEVDPAPMIIYYQKGRHLARFPIVPQYASPTVTLSGNAWRSAMKYIDSSKKERLTKHQLLQILKDQELENDGEKLKETPANHEPSDDAIRLAPFGIFRLPFVFEPFQMVKLWLRADMNEYVLTPKPQLIELNPDVRICLQHNSEIESCFTRSSHIEPSRPRYSFRDNYFKIWEEIVLAEAAVNSVKDTEQLVFTDLQLNFSDFAVPPECTNEEFYEPVGEIWCILPQKFLANRQDLFPIEQGYFACVRFDVDVDGFALQDSLKSRLYSRATDNHVRTVMHLVVDHVTKADDKEKEKEIRMTLEEEVIKADLKVYFKVVGKHNARVSPVMKELLKMQPPPCCEMQLLQMFLPIKKVYHSLRLLHKLDSNSLCERVALGKLEALVEDKEKFSVKFDEIRDMLFSDPYTHWHWDDSCGRLNRGQIKALMHAMVNEFQLIQGPPGTGKSITGAHIAYAFAMWNRMKAAQESATTDESECTVKSDTEADESESTTEDDDASSLPPLQCVIYCGPSNASVDVVLQHLHGMAVSCDNPNGLRILRMYGKMIETRYHVGPYYDPNLYAQIDKYPIREDLQQYALHDLVRTQSSQHNKINEMEAKFKDMQRDGLISTADERFAYREEIRKAEEEIIKTGNFDIVLCTCNETSGYRFRRNISPIQCIIDEAGMATEPETIVALSQARQAVLIGDHMQLQPVVMSKVAEESGLKVSLFERYANLFEEKYREKSCTNFVQLTQQYRMLKPICEFPSKKFYGRKLKTETHDTPFPFDAFWPSSSGPIAFCDVVGYEEEAETEEDIKTSKKNEMEADRAIEVVKALDEVTQSRAEIAVITPYKAQERCIIKRFNGMKKNWKVKTVDASQGSEADFVVLSTVRCKPLDELKDETDRQWMMDNLGHVTDSHRLCVALTRARYGLVIIGNQALLSKDPMWKEFIDHCKERKYMVYRNETRKFPPQWRMNQVRASKHHEVGRPRVRKSPAKLYRKPIGITEEQKTIIREVEKDYREQLQELFDFLLVESKQISSLTITVTQPTQS